MPMMHRTKLAGLIVLLAASGVLAIESGPAVGKRIPGSFRPMNVTGDSAGKRNCLVCQNGENPVAMVFARELSDPVIQLIKKLDAESVKNAKKQMGSFVVFLSDDESLCDKLKALAEKEDLKECLLAMDAVSGPQGFNIAKEADVTVILYEKQIVRANHAFKKGELDEKAIASIVKDVAKILN
jgi:hypothetical protein